MVSGEDITKKEGGGKRSPVRLQPCNKLWFQKKKAGPQVQAHFKRLTMSLTFVCMCVSACVCVGVFARVCMVFNYVLSPLCC